jgi:hypothetical protein
MADSRGFFKVANGFPEHRKIEAAGGDAGWLWVCAMGYCSRNFTDGMIPIGMVPRLSDREDPKQLAKRLLEVGLWHAAGHNCGKCVQPDARHYIVHDYLDHQTSAAKAREVSEKRAVAGRKGGQAKSAASKLPEPGYDSASSKSLPELEVEVEVHRKNSSSPADAADDTPAPKRRAPKTSPSDGFDAFWAAYPKKVGKPAAERAYGKALKAGADPAAILDGAIAYALQCRTVEDPHFIKHPQGWLNDGRWADQRAASGQPDAAPTPRPPWCGQCDETTRMVGLEQPRRCPRCHPNTQKANTT